MGGASLTDRNKSKKLHIKHHDSLSRRRIDHKVFYRYAPRSQPRAQINTKVVGIDVTP